MRAGRTAFKAVVTHAAETVVRRGVETLGVFRGVCGWSRGVRPVSELSCARRPCLGLAARRSRRACRVRLFARAACRRRRWTGLGPSPVGAVSGRSRGHVSRHVDVLSEDPERGRAKGPGDLHRRVRMIPISSCGDDGALCRYRVHSCQGRSRHQATGTSHWAKSTTAIVPIMPKVRAIPITRRRPGASSLRNPRKCMMRAARNTSPATCKAHDGSP